MDSQPTKGRGQKTASLALFEDWKQVKDPYNLPWKHFTRWMWMRLKTSHPAITYAQAMKRSQRVWKNNMKEPEGGWGSDILTEAPSNWERILAEVMTNKSKTKTNAGLMTYEEEALPPMPDESVGGYGASIVETVNEDVIAKRTELSKRNETVKAMLGKSPKITQAVMKAKFKDLNKFFTSDEPLGPDYGKKGSVYRGEYEMPSEFETRGGLGVPPINFKNPGGFYEGRPMRDEGESLEAFESRKRAYQTIGQRGGESDEDYVKRILAKQTALLSAIGGTAKGGSRSGETKVLFPKREGETDAEFIQRFEAMKKSGGRGSIAQPGIVHYYGAFFGLDTDEDWVKQANAKVKQVRESVSVSRHQALEDWGNLPNIIGDKTFEEQMKEPVKKAWTLKENKRKEDSFFRLTDQEQPLPYGNIPKERYGYPNPLDISDPEEFKTEMAKLGLAPSYKVPDVEIPDAKFVKNEVYGILPDELADEIMNLAIEEDPEFDELLSQDWSRESFLKGRTVFPVPITKQKGRASGISKDEAEKFKDAVIDEKERMNEWQSTKNVKIAVFIQDVLLPIIERKIEDEEDDLAKEYSENLIALSEDLKTILKKSHYWESYLNAGGDTDLINPEGDLDEKLQERRNRRVVVAKEEFKGNKADELKARLAELKKELGAGGASVMAPKVEKPVLKEGESKAQFYERMNEFLARTEMESEDKPSQRGKIMGGSKVPPWGKKTAPDYTKANPNTPAYVSSRMGAKTGAGTQLEKGLVEPPPTQGDKTGANLEPIKINGEDFPRDEEIPLTLKSSETYKHGTSEKALFPTRGAEKHSDRALLPDKIRGVPFEDDNTRLVLFAYNPPRKVGEAVIGPDGKHIVSQIDRNWLPSAKGLTLELDERKRGRPERDVVKRIDTINQGIKDLFEAFNHLPMRDRVGFKELTTTELWKPGGYSIRDSYRGDEQYQNPYYKLSFRLTDLLKERYMLEVYGKRYLSHAPKGGAKDEFGRPEPYYGGMARSFYGRAQPAPGKDTDFHYQAFGPYGKKDKTEYLRPELMRKEVIGEEEEIEPAEDEDEPEEKFRSSLLSTHSEALDEIGRRAMKSFNVLEIKKNPVVKAFAEPFNELTGRQLKTLEYVKDVRLGNSKKDINEQFAELAGGTNRKEKPEGSITVRREVDMTINSFNYSIETEAEVPVEFAWAGGEWIVNPDWEAKFYKGEWKASGGDTKLFAFGTKEHLEKADPIKETEFNRRFIDKKYFDKNP